MTFLLQKFNAITRTEARARNGLRSSASGIAFTGRLAVCLLIAGFLGVGSAMAQPTVLRMGGGAVIVQIGSNEVHHYLTDTDADGSLTDEKPTAAGTNPTGLGGTATNTFLIGGLALVTYDPGSPNELIVSPIGPGIFKIAVSPDGDADLSSTNMGTPYEFEVLSGNAPMLTGLMDGADGYNDAASLDMAETAALIPRDDTSKEYENINTWFSDPDDIFLTYTASADSVQFCKAGSNPCALDKAVAVATAKIDGTTLTVALTDKAKATEMDSSNTAVWVFAHDAAGEYARKRIDVTVGAATNPYVMNALEDMTLREDDGKTMLDDLHMGFMDPDVGSTDRSVDDAQALEFSVKISDDSAQKVETAMGHTLVASYMIAEVVEGATASIEITPRDVASTMVTVTATDKGVRCLTTEVFIDAVEADPGNNIEAADAYCYTETSGSSTGSYDGEAPDPDDRTDDQKEADATEKASRKSTFHQTKSVSDTFMLSIISKTTPKVSEDEDDKIEDMEIKAADGDAITFDLEDLNGDKDGEPMAFEDPTEGGLTYALTAKQVKDDDIASISVDGSMVTISPEWWAGGKDGSRSTPVEVIATNTLDESSVPVSFMLKVGTATKPVVNSKLAPFLGELPPFEVKAGSSITFDLTDVTKGLKDVPAALKGEPLLIDPNAATAKQGEGLPGGLLYKVQVEDVEAQHRYDDLSRENHVVTSAGTVMLDPSTAMLTITGTAPNYMNVTVWGIDREQDMTSATMMFVVPEVTSAEGEELPTEVELSQNYPNPFNPQTTIDYALPQAGDVSLVVYDMLGREVDVLLDGPQAAGRHTVRFGANHLPNGAYVYRLVAGDKTITRTMVLVK